MVGALFADVKSVFPSVHHLKLLDTLAKKGINSEILNIINNFLSSRKTNIAFNGYKSEAFDLTHGLPQGSPLSPLLYLIYNTTLLEISDRTEHAEALGFINDVIMLTSANDTHRPQVSEQRERCSERRKPLLKLTRLYLEDTPIRPKREVFRETNTSSQVDQT